MNKAIENKKKVASSAKKNATNARIEHSIVFDQLTYHLFDDVMKEAIADGIPL
jgi:23S rRNA G2445 N2-methylase RlmL